MIEQKSTREYLKLESTGIIAGELVFAKTFNGDAKSCQLSCKQCVFYAKNVCFDKRTKKRLNTAPACFGNDPENKSKKPLYYVIP